MVLIEKDILIKNLLLCLALLLTVCSAEAKYITALNGQGVLIERVFVHESGAISIYIAGELKNLDNCTATFRVYIPPTATAKDEMLSLALFAYASGKRVGFHGSGCSTTSFWGGTQDVPIVNNMWVH